MADDAVKGLLYALHDSVMLLAPAGWSTVELRFAAGNVSELVTRGEGARAPRGKPDLDVDPKLESHRLSRGLAELFHLLAHQGREFSPGTVRVERAHDFADWRLVRADGATAWFTRLERAELDGLLITDALFAAVQGTERAFAELQASLEAKLCGVTDWSFDGLQLVLQRGASPLVLPCHLVGRYLGGSFTWAWGWADPALAPQVVDGVRDVCAPLARPAGLSAFWRDQFHCDEGFAWALASHVAVGLGARGLYRAPLPDGSSVVFAIAPQPKAN